MVLNIHYYLIILFLFDILKMFTWDLKSRIFLDVFIYNKRVKVKNISYIMTIKKYKLRNDNQCLKIANLLRGPWVPTVLALHPSLINSPAYSNL